MKKKIAYGVTGLILGCIFLFPIYILIMNSFKTTKGIFTDVLGFPAKETFTLENYKNAFDICRFYVDSISVCHASIGWICKQNRFAVSWWLDLYVYGLSNKYGNHNVSWVHKKYSGGIGGSRYN